MTPRHASDGGRRGIATWIIVTVVAVVLLAGGITAYLLIVDDDEQSAGACQSQVVLPVVTAPGPAAAITQAATAFDATAPVARSACVSTTVTTLPDDEAATALATDWQPPAGPPPGMWIPASEAALTGLETTDSPLTAGRDNDPLATSPVVLAVSSDDAAAVEAAGLSWAALGDATGPDGSLTLPSGEKVILALPDPTTNRATSYALQSYLAAGTGTQVDAADVPARASDLAAIGAGGPTPQPATTQDALTQLAAGNAGFTAVPVVESDLAAFTATTPGLTAVSPTGGTVGDAVYAAPLSASWVDPTLKDAAAVFFAYLRGAGGDTAFTDNGLRVEGQATDGPPVTAIPAGGQDVDAAIAAAVGATPAG
jgi:hypothetical protein